MDLDDLLDDLLEDAGKAVKRGVRNVKRSTKGGRRKVRRGIRAVGGVTGAILLALAAVLLLGDPGAIAAFFGIVLLLGGLAAGGSAVAAHMLERRDPEVAKEKAMAAGTLTPDMLDEDLRELPKDVREEFRRLLAARRLVQDLRQDGWVDPASMLEVDGQVARLHRLLVADQRAAGLGGTPSAQLREQVSELADLLVALADEAVQHQADAMADHGAIAATLADARDHLVALREARQAVRDIDRGQRGTTGGTVG